MKCPKCGYISFDYNHVCPKCTKDISAEQAKLNFPAFRPNPPSLLGALTGEANESNVGLRMGAAAALGGIATDIGMGLDDSSAIETEDLSFEESQDMEISFDGGGLEALDEAGPAVDSLTDLDLGGGEVEMSMDTGGISMPDMEGEEEAVSLDFGELPEEEISLDEDLVQTEPEEGDALSLDLEGLALDETESVLPEAEEAVDLDAFSLEEEDMEEAGEVEGGIELQMDELSLDDSGSGLGEALDLGAVAPETEESGEEETELDLGDISFDDSGPVAVEADEALDLEGLALDETEGVLPEAEEAVDLDAFSLEEEAGEEGESELRMDELSLDDSGPGAGEELDLEAVASEAEAGPEEGDKDEDALDLDEFTFEEEGPAGDEEGIDLGDFSIETEEMIKDEDRGEIELTLDDLKVNETGELEIGKPQEPRESPSLDMEELSLDEPPAEEKDSGGAETGLADIPIDLDEISLTEEILPEEAESGDSSLSFDLENLDLELDLDDPEKN